MYCGEIISMTELGGRKPLSTLWYYLKYFSKGVLDYFKSDRWWGEWTCIGHLKSILTIFKVWELKEGEMQNRAAGPHLVQAGAWSPWDSTRLAIYFIESRAERWLSKK